MAGLQFDVYDPADALIGTLTQGIKKSMRAELNGTGAGQVEINRNSSEAAFLLGGYSIKVTDTDIDPDPIFSFFIEDSSIKVISREEGGGENLLITGRGGLAYLERAIWLAKSFVAAWWISGSPAAGDIGQVEVAAGTHVRYTITSGKISSTATFSTPGFTAFYDQRKSFAFAAGRAGITRVLVHLSSGAHSGEWIHIYDIGYTDHPAHYAINNTILLSTISPANKPGQVLYRMYQEAVDAARAVHPVSLLTVDFNATVDSAGAAWTATDALIGITADLGESYLTTIGKLIGTGAIDIVIGPNLDLHAFNSYGRPLAGGAFGAGVIRFEKGVNIADELGRHLIPQPVATWAEVLGTDDVVAAAALPGADPLREREVSIKGETNDATALTALGVAELVRQFHKGEAIQFGIAPGADVGAGRYLPAGPTSSADGQFWIGDTVRLHTGTGTQDFNEADVRVTAVTLAEDEAGNLTVIADLGGAGMPLGGRSLIPPTTICPCGEHSQVDCRRSETITVTIA